jgi:hypothetical protein
MDKVMNHIADNFLSMSHGPGSPRDAAYATGYNLLLCKSAINVVYILPVFVIYRNFQLDGYREFNRKSNKSSKYFL